MQEKINKIITYSFFALFFFVPLILYPRTSELFEFNKIILVYLLTIVITASWTIKMILQNKIIFRRTMVDIPLIIFLASQLISTVTSLDPRTSFLGYYSRFNGGFFSLVSYSLLYWAFISNMDKKKTLRLIYVAFISTIFVSIYGVLQHFGIDKDVWVQDVRNRIFSTFGQPNWLATWLAAIIPVTWAVTTKNPKTRNFLLFGVSVLFFITLLFTKSRSGLLGFVAADIILLVGVIRTSKKAFSQNFLIFNFIFLIFAFAVGTPWTPSLGKMFSNNPIHQTPDENQPAEATPQTLLAGGTESGEIRKIVWGGAVDIWKNYPIFGTGVETFAFS